MPQSGAEIYSSLRAAAKHSSALRVSTAFHEAVSTPGFFYVDICCLHFHKISCVKQNATPILELEGPIRSPSGCTLELPPGTQLFAGAGVQTQRKAPCGPAG